MKVPTPQIHSGTAGVCKADPLSPEVSSQSLLALEAPYLQCSGCGNVAPFSKIRLQRGQQKLAGCFNRENLPRVWARKASDNLKTNKDTGVPEL